MRKIFIGFFIYFLSFCIAVSMYSEKDIGLEYISENLKTRPIKEEDRDFWYDLHASESVCKYFRDGKTRSAEQVKAQFDRSLARFKNGDPRYLHVIEQLIEDRWIKVGVVVLGGSSKPKFLECAMITHPAFDTENNQYLDIFQNKTLESENQKEVKNSIHPIWGNKNASRILQWGLKNYIPFILETKVKYSWENDQGEVFEEVFDGSQYIGIYATATNPASMKVLTNYGFTEKGKSECNWGSKYIYEYLFKV